MVESVRVVFVTTVFNRLVKSGPELYAQNLWNLFRDDSNVEFHVVCLNSDIVHERVHSVDRLPIGFGRDYRAIENKLKAVLPSNLFIQVLRERMVQP